MLAALLPTLDGQLDPQIAREVSQSNLAQGSGAAPSLSGMFWRTSVTLHPRRLEQTQDSSQHGAADSFRTVQNNCIRYGSAKGDAQRTGTAALLASPLQTARGKTLQYPRTAAKPPRVTTAAVQIPEPQSAGQASSLPAPTVTARNPYILAQPRRRNTPLRLLAAPRNGVIAVPASESRRPGAVTAQSSRIPDELSDVPERPGKTGCIAVARASPAASRRGHRRRVGLAQEQVGPAHLYETAPTARAARTPSSPIPPAAITGRRTAAMICGTGRSNLTGVTVSSEHARAAGSNP